MDNYTNAAVKCKWHLSKAHNLDALAMVDLVDIVDEWVKAQPYDFESWDDRWDMVQAIAEALA